METRVKPRFRIVNNMTGLFVPDKKWDITSVEIEIHMEKMYETQKMVVMKYHKYSKPRIYLDTSV